MSRKRSNLFRINLAEYFLIMEEGLYKRIAPRPKLLFDNHALVIVSKLDQKVYDFTGFNASEEMQETASKLAKELGTKNNFPVECIFYPEKKIPPEHLQFIEYFADDLYVTKSQLDTSKHYKCYFCEHIVDKFGDSCPSCGKEIHVCFVCDFPVLFGDIIGKCSKCGAVAHLIHFYEWIKTLGMCSKCNEKLSPEGVIPLTEENKEKFF
ncbi:MAG: hypothetical protein FK733_16325 [Asgard group archaeon]|nr:hypothetical protein [Asgard group archaeon]